MVDQREASALDGATREKLHGEVLRFLFRFPNEHGVLDQRIYCLAVQVNAGDNPDAVIRQAIAYLARA